MKYLENTGQYVSEYYQHIASPNLAMPPDKFRENNSTGVSVRHHMLNDARLTVISRGAEVIEYMRFFGLASEIPQNERELLGFSGFDASPDLVIAYPTTSRLASEFRIVPSEVLHWTRRSAQRLAIQRSAFPYSPMPTETKWLSVYSHKHLPGLYIHTDDSLPNEIIDVHEALPATTEACLSVAKLLVMRELEVQL